MSPSEWCAKMRDEAEDGDTAYIYHQLAELWRQREREKRPCSE